ncbi:hypothetical protein [Sulfobacillus harzensis]|uniref:Uncharacterized protein n=1 Tax=Sulfobacillus harzensis TaxID=2729629 RepID=A0A7Y0L6A8_9FIRM|nr:hypothetical protein [Sulfobacillus harzensis]NMP24010.1 hypothetical protein [Sulfobacillus harzensis]
MAIIAAIHHHVVERRRRTLGDGALRGRKGTTLAFWRGASGVWAMPQA